MTALGTSSRTRARADLARQLRVDAVRCTAAAGSGHPTSSMSAADLMAVLLDGYLTMDLDAPGDPGNDHLIFSKGHASPLYYAMLKAAGVISDDELLTYRRFGSRLEGHPTPRLPPTEVATGSLGQGLPIGVGIALAGRDLDRLPYRTWVLCGDSELAEGSMWEAFQYGGWARLSRLTAIIDVNRWGQTRETMLGWNLAAYAARLTAFGWEAIPVDGHDPEQIAAAFDAVMQNGDRPTAILARTLKGRGVADIEDRPGYHGKPLNDPTAAIAELGGPQSIQVRLPVRQRDEESAEPSRAPARPRAPAPTAGGPDTPERTQLPEADPGHRPSRPSWLLGDRVATRQAYGRALAALGDERPDVVVLDAEVSNSTFSQAFAQAHPGRYFEMFIAEQQMVAAAVGLQVRRRRVFASTFAAFLSRAHDFIRMAAISRADLCLVGSHAGVAIGEDGPSQMALEDIAMMRALPGSTVLHPSDANQTARLVEAMADRPGISYLRTLRSPTPVRTAAQEAVTIGGSRLVCGGSADDQVTVIACGVTVDEAERAAQELAGVGIAVRVLDCYSIKPLDGAAIRRAADETAALITVEDHRPEGGLGEAVLSELAAHTSRPPVTVLGVREVPMSGTAEQLLAAAGIDAAAIEQAVREAVDPARDPARDQVPHSPLSV